MYHSDEGGLCHDQGGQESDNQSRGGLDLPLPMKTTKLDRRQAVKMGPRRQAVVAEPRPLEQVQRRAVQGLSRAFVAVSFLALLLETVVAYGRSFQIGLTGDDLPLITQSSAGIWAALTARQPYHYNPIPQAMLAIMYRLAGVQAVWYHAVALVLFAAGGLMVLLTAWRLTGDRAVAILAAIVFIGYGNQFEAAIWGGVAFWHSTSTIVYLGGLLLFMRWRRPELSPKQRRLSYVGFLAALVLGPLVHEQTVSLLPACALYRFIVVDRFRLPALRGLGTYARSWLGDFALPVILFLGYLRFKEWLGSQTTVPQAPGLTMSWHQIALVIQQGLLQAALPGTGQNRLTWLDLWWSRLPAHALWLAAGLVVLAAVFRALPNSYRFLLAWGLLLVLVMSVSLGAIVSRHLYLIVVPPSILWAGLLVWLARELTGRIARMTPLRGDKRVLAVAGACVLAAVLVADGTAFAQKQETAWIQGTHVQTQLLASLKQQSRDHPGASNLYLIDLPDSIPSSTGNVVYMYRNSTAPWVSFNMPGRFHSITAIRTSDMPANPSAQLINPLALAQIAQQPDTLLLQYHDQPASLQRWRPIAPSILRALRHCTAAPMQYSLDVMGGTTVGGRLYLPPAADIDIPGWAVDPHTTRSPAAVFMTMDGKHMYQSQYGLYRPDVARALGNPAYTRSGLFLTIPASDATAGQHVLQVLLVDHSERACYARSSALTFWIR